MVHPVQSPATSAPRGLIDTLQTGFSTVNHHWWLLALPVALDAALWLGPQLTLGRMIDALLGHVLSLPGLEDVGLRLGESTVQSLQALRSSEELTRYNVLWLLAVPLLGIPSFQAGGVGLGPSVPIESPTAGLAVLGGVLLVGLGLAALFYGLLAQAVRTGRSDPDSFARAFGPVWVRLVGLFLLATSVFLGAGLLVGLLLAALEMVSPALVALAGSLTLGVVLWAFVYLFFTTEALYISSVGPATAVRCSVSVVKHNFWPSIGFILLVIIINNGLPIIFNQLARTLQAAGTALAILGHIYISSGIIAGTMTYYKERFERLSAL